jgi:hypothetical protein
MRGPGSRAVLFGRTGTRDYFIYFQVLSKSHISPTMQRVQSGFNFHKACPSARAKLLLAFGEEFGPANQEVCRQEAANLLGAIRGRYAAARKSPPPISHPRLTRFTRILAYFDGPLWRFLVSLSQGVTDIK